MTLWKLLFGLREPKVEPANDARRGPGDEAVRAWILQQRESQLAWFPRYWG